MQTYNKDVKFMYSRAKKFRDEAYYCQSNGLAALHDDDLRRQRSYVVSMREAIAKAVARPVQDLPESHPEIYELPDLEPRDEIENDVCQLLVQNWEDFIIECVRSNSSRYPNSLTSHDEVRLIKILDNIDRDLDYAQRDLPLDLPDSAPTKAVSPPGKGGVVL